jgi:hypothetical protein
MRSMIVFSLVTLCCMASVEAFASSCQATFTKKGNPVTGLRYKAIHSVTDTNSSDAINQLRGIVLARGYDVLAAEPASGNMLIEMPQTADRRAFQIIASATSEGSITTMQLDAKLRAGVFTNDDMMRTEMCNVLADLKGGNAGAAAAAQGKKAVPGAGPPTAMTAQTLSDRLSRERDKNPDEIPLRYQGRSFTLSGHAEEVRKDGDTYGVRFETLDSHQKILSTLPGESGIKTEIVCVLAPGQSVYALSLNPSNALGLKVRKRVTLTGTYHDYRPFPSPSVFWLRDCRPEQ